MLWTNCYVEEGRIFKDIEQTSQLNKFLYRKGLIKAETYFYTKHKLIRLLDELDESYKTIYEVHSRYKKERIQKLIECKYCIYYRDDYNDWDVCSLYDQPRKENDYCSKGKYDERKDKLSR